MSGQAIEFFEIDIPYCSLVYGVAPCTASMDSSPATGDAKCFNTLNTCQDTANIDLQTATLRFAKPADYLPRDIDIVGPWIKSIDFTPGTISLAENLGTRSVLKITLSDYPHSDAGDGLDKYQAERGYDPFLRGSFWPRFRARHPSLNGVACRWIVGFVGQALADMETRSFFVESFDGPTKDGGFSITAKDVLKFLDGDRAQGPVLSSGSLVADIDADDTSLTLTPAGIGNLEYAASGYVRIAGKEDCSFTRSADVLTLVRGQLNTTASAHSAGDRVQTVVRYAAMDPADIIEQHITTFSDLPAGYITLSDWLAETSANLGTLYTFTIGEPTSVAAFISRVIEQAGLMLWDDALNQQLRLKVIRSVPVTAATIDEASVIGNTFDPSDQPQQRVSRGWVYYAINDPTKRRDDLDNYRSSARTPDDAIAEASEALYGAQAIRKIFADGIVAGGGAVAERLGNILVGRRQRPPRRFKFSMLRDDNIILPILGSGYFLDWRSLQDASGARETVPVQIVSAKAGVAISQFVAEEMRFTLLGDFDPNTRVIPLNIDDFNLNLRTIHDQLYPATFDVGVTVTFIISALIGSTSTSLPAVDVGAWPVGFVPTINLSGRIEGRGGNGGNAGMVGSFGGPALYTRHPIELDVSAGEIWSGGGGGGGSALVGGSLGGGGGGGGQQPGVGGSPSGADGTTDLGGAKGSVSAGDGGNPGSAGQNRTFAGGAAGNAIDGISYVTITAGPGDIRGAQVN